MADVKWIKIYTDMLSNKKIKRIRRMPEGNNVILIWVFLIAEAGKCNRGGGLYLTDLIPFNADDLAIEFDFEVDIIKMALAILQKFEMLEIFDDVIYIKNWEKYQNIDGLDKIRQQTRVRVAKHRQEQRLLSGNVTCNVTVTHGNATDIDKELDIDKEKNKDISSRKAELPTRHKHGQYKNVILTDEQLDKLKSEFTDWEKRIERLDEYIQSKGAKYKDHLATIRSWAKKDKAEKPAEKETKYDYDDIEEKMRKKMWGE